VRITDEVPEDGWVPRECRATNGKVTVIVLTGGDITVEQALTLTSAALASV
jgi:hypothetical protein